MPILYSYNFFVFIISKVNLIVRHRITVGRNFGGWSQANACSKVDLVLGVLGWSTGCSWLSSTEKRQFLEC